MENNNILSIVQENAIGIILDFKLLDTLYIKETRE